MTTRRNVTLTLSEDALRRARYLAADKGVSLSRLLSDALEDAVLRNERYTSARKSALARMKRGMNLGVGPVPSWTREELHER